MSQFLLTLALAAVLMFLALCAMGVSWFLTGKSRMNQAGCSRGIKGSCETKKPDCIVCSSKKED